MSFYGYVGKHRNLMSLIRKKIYGNKEKPGMREERKKNWQHIKMARTVRVEWQSMKWSRTVLKKQGDIRLAIQFVKNFIGGQSYGKRGSYTWRS